MAIDMNLIALLFLLLPTVPFYFIIKKDIKRSIIFALLVSGVASLFALIIQLMGLSDSLKLEGIFAFLLILAVVFYAIVFLALFLMNEKVSFKTVSIMIGIILLGTLLIIGIAISSGLENVNLTLNSIMDI